MELAGPPPDPTYRQRFGEDTATSPNLACAIVAKSLSENRVATGTEDKLGPELSQRVGTLRSREKVPRQVSELASRAEAPCKRLKFTSSVRLRKSWSVLLWYTVVEGIMKLWFVLRNKFVKAVGSAGGPQLGHEVGSAFNVALFLQPTI